MEVLEVIHPNRQVRRLRGKSDPLDAEIAARAALAGEAAGAPKAQDGIVEAIRVLRVARRSAMKARTQAANQLHAIIETAPAELREKLRSLRLPHLVAAARRFRCVAPSTPLAAARFALKGLAERWASLDTEIKCLDAQLADLVASVAPRLLRITGVGTDTAGALLVTGVPPLWWTGRG